MKIRFLGSPAFHLTNTAEGLVVGQVYEVVRRDRRTDDGLYIASPKNGQPFWLTTNEYEVVAEEKEAPVANLADVRLSPVEGNAQADFRPLGEDDPKVNRSALIEMFTDFVLNETPGLDGVSIEIVHAFCSQLVDNALVFGGKQHDYGPGNISRKGERGVLVRAGDKIARLDNLELTGDAAKNEAVEDSWLDVSNYGAIAQIVRAGKWPGCQEKHLIVPRRPEGGK